MTIIKTIGAFLAIAVCLVLIGCLVLIDRNEPSRAQR